MDVYFGTLNPHIMNSALLKQANCNWLNSLRGRIYLLFLILVLSPLCSNAQQPDTEIDATNSTNNYQFTVDTKLIPCDNPDGTGEEYDPIYVNINEDNYKTFTFSKVKTLADNKGIVIKFWQFREDSPLRIKYNFVYTNNLQGAARYFIISTTDFETCRKRYSVALFKGGTSVTGGVVLLPIKFRFKTPNTITGENGGVDFSKDISLGLSIGLKQRISRTKPFFLNILGCAGIGSVGLDSFNTEGKMTSMDVPAWTLATGFVLDYKIIQFGAFVGWDIVSSKNRNSWIYQGAPWISVGIGYSLFSVSTAASNKEAKQ